jgi:hypothetical protein
MRIHDPKTPRRLAAYATIAALVGAATAAGVAFAGGSGTKPQPPATSSLSTQQQLKRQHAGGPNTAKPQPPASSSLSPEQQLKQQHAGGPNTPKPQPPGSSGSGK